jgi:hypothetical protein
VRETNRPGSGLDPIVVYDTVDGLLAEMSEQVATIRRCVRELRGQVGGGNEGDQDA